MRMMKKRKIGKEEEHFEFKNTVTISDCTYIW